MSPQPPNPETDWGEVEIRADYIAGIEETIVYPYLGQNGVPAKAYHTYIDYFRAGEYAGKLPSDPDLKGRTLKIKRRRGSERR